MVRTLYRSISSSLRFNLSYHHGLDNLVKFIVIVIVTLVQYRQPYHGNTYQRTWLSAISFPRHPTMSFVTNNHGQFFVVENFFYVKSKNLSKGLRSWKLDGFIIIQPCRVKKEKEISKTSHTKVILTVTTNGVLSQADKE